MIRELPIAQSEKYSVLESSVLGSDGGLLSQAFSCSGSWHSGLQYHQCMYGAHNTMLVKTFSKVEYNCMLQYRDLG